MACVQDIAVTSSRGIPSDETEDLDETPKWPTGLDPVKREALTIMKDLVDLTENARLAGLLKGTAEAR